MNELGLSRRSPRTLPVSGAVREAGDINVVFIHGILSNSVSAWTDANGTAWPHLLEDEPAFAAVGIFTFAYSTGVTTETYSVEQVTTALQAFLQHERVLDGQRLLFVAHSMGGIAARRWLVQQADELARRKIAIGLLLVASPSLGSGYANLLQELNRFLGNSQLTGLELADRNQWLDGLDRDFQRLLWGGTLTVLGTEIVEDRPPSFLRILTTTPIVERYSANRYFSDSVTVSGSDHMSVCKPHDRDAIQHTVLLNLLERLSTSGPATRVVIVGIALMRDGFLDRGTRFVAALDDAIGELGSSLTPKDQESLLRMRRQFQELMARHLALIAEGQLLDADLLRVNDIAPLRDDVIDFLEDRGGSISRDLFRVLRRHYIDAPNVGEDLAYDQSRRDAGAISDAIAQVRAARYDL
jgi:pimeloyl-ACP methyl ester carboxylesterase